MTGDGRSPSLHQRTLRPDPAVGTVDPDTLVSTRSDRPVKLIAEEVPLIKEALA